MLTFALLRNRMQKKNNQTHWYLLYTNPRAEKKVAMELQHKGYEIFLPMHKTLKQWSDRKKWVAEPLFKSYIFIYAELVKHYYDILNVAGIVKFVSFEKFPAVVDPREITFLKLMLGNGAGNIISVEENSNWEGEMGDDVEVISGPLIGLSGKLIQKHGAKLLQIELETMHQTLLIRIPQDFVRLKEIING
jgi:transcription antitermination factor NusG